VGTAEDSGAEVSAVETSGKEVFWAGGDFGATDLHSVDTQVVITPATMAMDVAT
jgi:hypothetical protein